MTTPNNAAELLAEASDLEERANLLRAALNAPSMRETVLRDRVRLLRRAAEGRLL